MGNMNKNSYSKSILGSIFVMFMALTILTICNVEIFNIYADVSLYANIAIVFLGAIFCRGFKAYNIIFIVFVGAYLLLSIIIANGGIGSVITLVVPLMLLTVYSNMLLSSKIIKILKFLCVITIFLLFLYSPTYHENYLLFSKTKINPNTLGMFLMFCFMIICVFTNFENKKSKASIILLFILTVLGMYNYESRGTTLAVCCFCIMVIIPREYYNRKKFFMITIIFIVVGTAFPFIYLKLYNTGYQLEVFGKSLYTGRENLWSNMFNLMSGDTIKILFGVGSDAVLWDNDLNVHNNFFNIITNFGVVGFCLYYIFILSQIWKVTKYIYNPIIRKSVIMFTCSVMILGFSETTSLWSVIFPFAYLGLIVANSEHAMMQLEYE